MAEDEFSELHPDEADGEAVDYDPFPEDAIVDGVRTLEKLARASISNTDKLTAALNRQAKVLDALAEAINARREVVRDENGKIKATRVVH
jgi:hypothetical protein